MQDSENFRERRAFSRFSVNIPAVYIDPISNSMVDTHTLDISAVGLGLLADRKLNVGDKLEIRLHNGEEINAKAKVVWMELTDDFKYRTGIKFDDLKLNPVTLILKRIQERINSRPPY